MDISIQNSLTARQVLKYTYGFVPIAAGLDKFTNLLTDWKSYIGPSITNSLPISAGAFMMLIGVIEIAAGICVLLRPRIGAYVVMIWLLVISLTLIFGGHYFDVAVRDIVMA